MPTIRSKIDSTIEYKETMKLADDDKGKDHNIYQIELFGIDILITIGNPKNINDVIYFPIYLIKHNRKVLQIGLYEIEKKIISYNTIDDSNLMDYINLSNLILYSFVNIRFIQQLYLSPDHYKLQEEEQNIQNEEEQMIYNSSRLKSQIFKSKPTTSSVLLLETESKNDFETIHSNYTESKNNFWVSRFMKNNFYSLTRIPGDGNCFFRSILESFKTIGEHTTVPQLKQILVDNLNEDIFNSYFQLYNSLKDIVITLKNEKKEYVTKYNSLIDQKNTSSEVLMKEIRKELKELKNQIENIDKELQMASANMDDVSFMRGVTNIEDLKNKIKNTTEYYADDWAVSLIEYILNVKTIILSKDEYDKKDLLNVLRISETYQSIIDANVFNPDHYIILEFGGIHYQLIKYKGKGIFKFSELPYDLKILITDKCLASQCGGFRYIQDFTDLTNERRQARSGNKQSGGKQSGGKQSGSKQSDDEQSDLKNIDDMNNQILDELYQYGNVKLWDDDVKLFFYDKAKDDLPGRFNGEQLPKSKFHDYVELSKIKNWRKKLDNNWIQPFILDGKTWASVEHYYQASKFKNYPELYNKFSIDENSELSKNPYRAKQFADKYIELIDKNFNPKIELYTAQDAKFLQHDDLSYLLICTNMANLYQQRRGIIPLQATNLMIIRKRIVDQNS